jgi:hypothetical protein
MFRLEYREDPHNVQGGPKNEKRGISMSWKRFSAIAQLFLYIVLFSNCGESNSSNTTGDASNRDTSNRDTSNRDTSNGGATHTDNEAHDTQPYFRDTEGNEVCVSLDLTVEQLPVRVMILQDRSTSMNDFIGEASKWEWAEAAVEAMVTQFETEIEFGLDFFPLGTERCDVATQVMADSAPLNADAINYLMATYTTPPSSLGTPLYLALNNFVNTDYAPLFEAITHDSYLIVVSDGSDTCGVTGQDSNPELESDLAQVTAQLLNENRIRTFAIGFGDESVYGQTGGIDADQLNAIAENGGTTFTHYINAQNGQVLQEALSSIAEAVHIGCSFEMGEYNSDEVDLDLVNVYFDKTVDPATGHVTGAIGRDDGCAAGVGWSWINEERTAIQFCESACSALQSQSVDEISIEIMCSKSDVVII